MVACRWHISLHKYFYINYNAEFSVYKLIFLSTNSVCFKRLFFFFWICREKQLSVLHQVSQALSVENLSLIVAPVKRVHNSRKLWDHQRDFCSYINKQSAILRFLKLQGTYISYKKGVLDLVIEHPPHKGTSCLSLLRLQSPPPHHITYDHYFLANYILFDYKY